MTAKAQADMLGICQIIDKTVDVEKIYLFGSHAYGTPTAGADGCDRLQNECVHGPASRCLPGAQNRQRGGAPV